MMQNNFLSLLMGDGLIRMPFMRHGWNVKSSIWVGCRGMEWILSCFADIRDWVLGKDALCKRLRENSKLLEFCGRLNKAVLFVVIVVFNGGAWRDCVMIPASSNHAGSYLFQKELGNFLSSAKPAILTGVSFRYCWW